MPFEGIPLDEHPGAIVRRQAVRVTLAVIKGPHEGREFSFEEHDNFIVGRAKFVQFRLPVRDKFFSRVHFMVEVNPPLCRLTDMGSTNGVAVNGRKVTSADLRDGDLIKAGQTVIRIAIEAPGCDELPDSEAPFPSAGFEHAAVEVTLSLAQPFRPPTLAAPSPEAEAPAAPRDAPSIPGYQIVRELGRGGMGIVYLASRKLDGTLVALKTIEPAVVGTQVQTERFLREARILGQLDHPHIVPFRAMGKRATCSISSWTTWRGATSPRFRRSSAALC